MIHRISVCVELDGYIKDLRMILKTVRWRPYLRHRVSHWNHIAGSNCRPDAFWRLTKVNLKGVPQRISYIRDGLADRL
jgi:hypothetical protein